jgi:hypothetical protein
VSPADISILMVWLKRSANLKTKTDSVTVEQSCDSCETEL